MNEDSHTKLRQNDIRLSRKIFAVQAKPISQRMQHRAHLYLRLCILSANRRHIPAALFPRMNIGHVLVPAGSDG